MYCKICGAPLTPGDGFCKNCGASNNNVAEPKAPEVEPVINEVPQVDNVPEGKIIEENVNPESNAQAEVIAPAGVEEIVPTPAETIENAAPVEQAPAENVEPTINSEPVQEEQKEVEENKEDKSGKFLLIIGVIVGLLAIAVIAYLVYSSMSKNTPVNGGSQVTLITQNNYTVRYGSYNFTLSSTDLVDVGETLHIENANFITKIAYVDEPAFASLTVDNVKDAFANVTEYKVDDVVSKTYSGLSCLEGNVTYANNAKTTLLLCNRENGGYWSMEVGIKGFASYPTSDINNSVVKFIADAKKVTVEDSPLKVGKVQVEIPTEEPTETENQ